MRPLIIANWKSNPATVVEAVSLARKAELAASKHRNVEVVIAPPFPFLSGIGRVLKRAKLGAQNSFWEDGGPYTGEVSWRQLKHLGVKYVIAGHSERKIHLGETDEMVNQKVNSLLENGLIPVLCIGERERVGGEMPSSVGEQLKRSISGVKKRVLKNLVVVYEPVWAVSTMPGSRPDTPDDAFRAAIYIRKIISEFYGRVQSGAPRVIYGGSVNSSNIASFLRDGKMEGALVGKASLDYKEFALTLRVAAGK